MIIPFANTIGIQEGILENHHDVQNHLGSIHAGAQFTFAENASGEYLSSKFPAFKDRVIPLLRESSIKYKKQAIGRIRSEVMVEQRELERFEKIFNMKNRATISLNVKLFDEVDEIVCVGNFKWFVVRSD
jgi:acyl-coenzyme A thioesterase PaaI-like protein